MGRGSPEQQPGRPRYLKEFLEWAAKFDDLEASDRLVLCALFGYLGKNDSCWPTQRVLAGACGLSTRHIRRILEKLDSKNIIRRIKRKNGSGNKNEYQFVFAQSDQTKEDTDVPFDETKEDIDVPFKADTDVPIKRTRMSLLKRTSEAKKNQEKQASPGRDGSLIISENISNKSVNSQGKNDGLTDEKEKEKPASEDVVSLVWNEEGISPMETSSENFVPPPGAPPRLPPEKIKAIFNPGQVPALVNLLECSKGDIDLGGLVFAFRINRKAEEKISRIIGFNPDTPKPSWFEESLKVFAERVFAIHWNWQSKPPGVPFRRRFERAGRSGLLYEWGFYPRSPEQQETRRLELERQEAQEQDEARLEEEQRRLLAEKEARLKAFISRPTVGNYLSFMGFPPRDYKGIRDHLREIAARLNGQATLNAVEQFMVGELKNAGY